MEHQRQILRLGAVVIVLAAAIRLVSAGFFTPILSFLGRPEVISFLMYLETGHIVRFQDKLVQPAKPDAPQKPQMPQTPLKEKHTFTAEDLNDIEIRYGCDYRPDLESLLMRPLTWHSPKVLIVHSHATETYTGEDIEYSGSYRTLQMQYNMVSVGEEVARVLRAGGIEVIHDKTFHDHPDYNSAYSSSRAAIEAYLRQDPSICMVLDIHRDASDSAFGQLITSATVGGQRSSQLMLVVGTDAGGNDHPNWQTNLSLALKLAALLEQNNPGICRPIDLRSERFNMDLTTGSLLVEVGAAGDSHMEAVVAANALAQGILEILQ